MVMHFVNDVQAIHNLSYKSLISRSIANKSVESLVSRVVIVRFDRNGLGGMELGGATCGNETFFCVLLSLASLV